MKVARYIGNLLFQYECIVIPGFGGFITKEIPAKIHPVQNHFAPPSKDIVFNVHLKANDGLLINHIAKAEKITYLEAKNKLENFVLQCEAALKNGKRIHFRKVGTICLDEAGFKQFEADSTQNYLADSFGLKSFISPPIKRTITGRPIIKQSAPDRKAADVHHQTGARKNTAKPKVEGPRYIRINVSAVVILILMSAFIFFKFTEVKKYYNNYSSFIPFLYSNPSDYLVANYVDLGVNKIFNWGDNLKSVGDKLNINYKLPSEEIEQVPIKEEKKEAPEPIEDTYKKLLEELKSETENLQAADVPENKELTSQPIENKTTTSPVIVKNDTPVNAAITPKYYIIAGSFQNLENADKFVSELKQKGFDANIAGTNKYNHYRVYFSSFNNLETATKQLAIIRKEENASAWILSL